MRSWSGGSEWAAFGGVGWDGTERDGMGWGRTGGIRSDQMEWGVDAVALDGIGLGSFGRIGMR